MQQMLCGRGIVSTQQLLLQLLANLLKGEADLDAFAREIEAMGQMVGVTFAVAQLNLLNA
ncbi:hypothetical protein UM93_03625 [Psychromicrobium lacuslunae]|uniref:Uncharacterized protein n=1 Tax=Psychromicrobium lacuslunae TaxID=1618207 RepID=A0A0D4BWY0_9MICC|nr:hypothetical protein UM93_03625 [Psychromicrobium lacuslunae]